MKQGKCEKCGRAGLVSEKSGLCRDCVVKMAISVQQAAQDEGAVRCARCGTPVRQPKNGPEKKYCSDACKQAEMRERLTGECKVCHELKVLNRERICSACKRRSQTPARQKGGGVGTNGSIESLKWDKIRHNISQVVAEATLNGTIGGGRSRR